MLNRRCRAAGEGLFTCSLNELNRNLSFMKEEFGNPHILYSFIAALFLSNPVFFYFEIYEIDIYYEIKFILTAS